MNDIWSMNDNVAISCQNYANAQLNGRSTAVHELSHKAPFSKGEYLLQEYSCSKWHNEVREESTAFLLPKQDLSMSEDLSI